MNMPGCLDITNKSAFLHSVAAAGKVSKICEPLKLLGIHCFGYLKIFRDGTYIQVCNGFLEFQKKYFENITSQGKDFTSESERLMSNLKYYVWPLDKELDMILELLYEHDIRNGFSIYHRTKTQLECFSFSLRQNLTSPANFFINNLEKLHQFAHYFKLAASDIIECSDKSKLACFKDGVSDCFFGSDADKSKVDKSYLFKTAIPQKLHFFDANGHPSTLSSRESQCIKHLARGKSFKEIALIYDVSPRTVEHHIANIKQKLHVQYKSELIDIFWKNYYHQFNND